VNPLPVWRKLYFGNGWWGCCKMLRFVLLLCTVQGRLYGIASQRMIRLISAAAARRGCAGADISSVIGPRAHQSKLVGNG